VHLFGLVISDFVVVLVSCCFERSTNNGVRPWGVHVCRCVCAFMRVVVVVTAMHRFACVFVHIHTVARWRSPKLHM